MPGIKIKENESFENALKRFKKRARRRDFIRNPEKRTLRKTSIKRKKKALAAKKRAIKKMRKMME